jgi:polar amino acid transport system substrate-binding protein
VAIRLRGLVALTTTATLVAGLLLVTLIDGGSVARGDIGAVTLTVTPPPTDTATATPTVTPSPTALATATSTATSSLNLKDPLHLTVGTDATYPPMESLDASTHLYVGADIDLAKALAKAMGLKGARFVNNTFSTIISSLERGNFDAIISSMNDTPEREKVISFVDYMRASEGIVVRKGSGIHASGYSGMCGKSIAVQRGTAEQFGMEVANKTCKSKIHIKGYVSDTAAFLTFATRKADAYTSDLPVCAQHLADGHGKYALAGKPIASGQDYGIGLPKGNTALRRALRKALTKIRSNGTYRTTLKKWGVGGGQSLSIASRNKARTRYTHVRATHAISHLFLRPS